MALFKGTRYTHTPAYIRDGQTLVLDIREPATFEADTIDGIAYEEYGNAALWWAIMDANPQFEHEIQIRPGDLLVIPPIEEVLKWL